MKLSDWLLTFLWKRSMWDYKTNCMKATKFTFILPQSWATNIHAFVSNSLCQAFMVFLCWTRESSWGEQKKKTKKSTQAWSDCNLEILVVHQFGSLWQGQGKWSAQHFLLVKLRSSKSFTISNEVFVVFVPRQWDRAQSH